MRAMDHAVEDRIGECGVAQVFVPAINRELTGDDRRSVAVAVVQDLEEILPLRVLEADQAPIVEDEDVDPREAGQRDGVRAVAVGQRELGKQTRNASVDRTVTLAAGLLAERTRQIGLPGRRSAR